MTKKFDVTDNPFADSYFILWKCVLANFLGWSEEQTRIWATDVGLIEEIKENNGWLRHEPPQFPLVGALTPKSLSIPAGLEYVNYMQKMRDALGGYWLDLNLPDNIEEFDWTPYRLQVEQVLAEYGATLPVGRIWHPRAK